MNPTLVALAGTVTEAGTATVALLLARLTLTPLLPAAALNATVQESVPDPVMVPLLQVSALKTGAAAAPVPLKLITAVGPVEELLEMVTWPVAVPALAGSNSMFSVADWFGFNVSGNAVPDIVKPVPVRVAALIVTGMLPVDVSVTDFVAGVFRFTLPKVTLVALRLSVGWAAFNFRVKLVETLFADAVSVTDCAELTDETFAVKLAVVAFAATVTVAGTVTAALLLARLTLTPPLPAAALNVTVQASVPDPVMVPLLQVSALKTGAAAAPVPLKLITAVGLVEELLEMVTWPVAVPALAGSNSMFSVADWFGFNVSGNAVPGIVKPVPVRVAALIVTGMLPVDVSVTDFVAGVFRFTLPKVTLVALRLSVG